MSRFNVPLGRWFGIPIWLHWSWVLLFLMVLVTNRSFALVYAGLFALVLLHELGHSLAARYYGIPTDNITLWPFGGIASIQVPSVPKQEFFVAVAGPAVNLLLIPILNVLRIDLPESYSNFCTQLGYYNIALLVFNLIPAFPMDGGRVFRSLLSMMLRNHLKATLIAVRVGQVICVGFGILGVMTGGFMLVVIAFFIFLAAEGELAQAKRYATVREITGIEVHNDWEALKAIDQKVLELQRRMEEEASEVNREV